MRITHTIDNRRTWHLDTPQARENCQHCPGVHTVTLNANETLTPAQEVANRHETARFEQGLNTVASIIDEHVTANGGYVRPLPDFDPFADIDEIPAPQAIENAPQATTEPQSAPVAEPAPEPVRACRQCQTPTPEGTGHTHNNKVFCDTCYNRLFKACRNCEDMERISDGATTTQGNFYCENCKDENAFYCDGCDTWYDGSDYENLNDYRYCNSCFSDRGFRCDSCEEAFDDDYHNTCERCDSEYCDDCWGEHEHNEALQERREEQARFRPVPADTFLEDDVAGCRFITHKRFVGIEIEAERGRVDYLHKVLPPEVGISHDGSLDSTGVEVQTAPAQGRKLERLVNDTCRAMRAQGYRATTNCGLHVHVDARDIRNNHNKIIQVIKTFYATEDLLFSMLPPSRWASVTGRKNYCQRLSKGYLYKNFSKKLTDQNKLELEIYQTKNEAEKEQRKHNKYDNARYYGLNIHSLFFRGTVEFRYHSGTTSPEKILMWAQLMLSIFEYAITNYDEKWVQEMFDMETSKEKFQKFATKLSLSYDLQSYMTNRTGQFNPEYLIKFNKGAEERRRDARKYTQVRKAIAEKAKTYLAKAENDVRNGYPPFRVRNNADLQRAIQEIAEQYAIRDLNVKAPQTENGFMSEEDVKAVVRFIQQGMSLARNNDRLSRDTQSQEDIEE